MGNNDYLSIAKERLSTSRKDLTPYAAQQSIAAALIALVERLDLIISKDEWNEGADALRVDVSRRDW